MTITPTRTWQRAMERAMRDGLKPTKQVDGTYRVRSTSRPGVFHTVTLDGAGHIIHCSDCPGWEQGGRTRPCKHAGAVALARIWELGASIAPVHTAMVHGPNTTRHTLYRAEVGAYAPAPWRES